MARKYYKRTRVVRPKKKWASNIIIRNYEVNSNNVNPSTDLVANSVQVGTPTPVILKTGNFKINCDVNVVTSAGGTLQMMALVMYVPEGIAITDNSSLGGLVTAHPEYIIAWRQFDTPFTTTVGSSSNSVQQVTVSSRLKRNLNSGDKIIFGVLRTDASATVSSIRVMITAQFWTCAN